MILFTGAPTNASALQHTEAVSGMTKDRIDIKSNDIESYRNDKILIKGKNFFATLNEVIYFFHTFSLLHSNVILLLC